MKPVGRPESDAILGAMRQVALARGGPITHADSASILAAARYLLRRSDLTDLGILPAVEPADLVAAVRDGELRREAVKYLAVMVLVDGALDGRKLARVLAYSRGLDVEEAYLTELVEAASGHMAWVVADMTRRNVESVIGRPSSGDGPDPAAWISPYGGDNARPELVARYEALDALPDNTFGKALWAFHKQNGYAFPGDPAALNERFSTPHDSTHVISGYDTSSRGEILVSTFTAGMHQINPMAGHILPVIFNGHLGIRFNDVARPATGGLDPDEFWHAWARGRDTTVDVFDPEWNVWDWVEHDLAELRRAYNVSPAGRAP